MDFILSYNNREGVMVFPVVPNDSLVWAREQKNETFDSVSGEMQALGPLNLGSAEISSFFPLHPYPFIRPGATSDGWSYVRTIEAVRARRIPFRGIKLDNDGREVFNYPLSVDSFEYWIDQAGDISYRLSFREYRFAEAPLSATLPAQKEPKGRMPTTAPAPLTAPLTDSQASAIEGLPDGGTAGSMTMRSGAVISSGNVIEVPPSVKQGGITRNYTDYVRNWKYVQGQLYAIWNQQGRPSQGGIAKLGGYYLVALTLKFGTTGDAVKIVLENGAVINAILGDSKSENPGKHGEAGTEYGHYLQYPGRGRLLDIVEWERYNGDIRTLLQQKGWLGQKVIRVINYGSWLNR